MKIQKIKGRNFAQQQEGRIDLLLQNHEVNKSLKAKGSTLFAAKLLWIYSKRAGAHFLAYNENILGNGTIRVFDLSGRADYPLRIINRRVVTPATKYPYNTTKGLIPDWLRIANRRLKILNRLGKKPDKTHTDRKFDPIRYHVG